MSWITRVAALALLGCFFSICPPSSRAGTGEIRDGKLDLSVLFLYREAGVESWKPVFDEASRLLYNASNGQLQLGTVRIYSCSTDHPDIDIWIQDNQSGAFANPLGLGAEGHVYLSQVHRSTTLPALGQFGLVHEIGHYAFGLYDEYKGETEPIALASRVDEQTHLLAPNQFCVTDDDGIACLMDGGTMISPNNQRTEFCTHAQETLSTRHNDGVVVGDTRYINAQEFYNQESCWETIARIAGLASPTIVDPIDPSGLVPIVWEVANGLDNMVLCIDRSASMYAPPNPIALSRGAALGIVDLLRAEKTIEDDGSELTIPGENLAVISFAAEAGIDFPLQPIVSEDTRTAARSAIETGDAQYLGLELSNIGGALQSALDEIVAQSDVAACSESIVLLTDGKHNGAVAPADVLPALIERGVRVYSIGVGDVVDEEFLENISSETHGQFFRLTQAEELPGIFTAVAAAIRADGTAATYGDSLDGSGEHLPIVVDGFAEEITAILSWDDGTLDLVLVTPSGERIDLGLADSREDIEAVRGDGFLYIRVVHPEAGTWIAEISPQEPEVQTVYDLTVLESDRGVSVTAQTDQAVYDFPDPVRLRVDVVAGVPVAGAEVTAKVTGPVGPQGPEVSIDLFDDGNPLHGDQWANDGVYNAIFGDYFMNGVYTFHITVVNVNGTGPDPDLPFVEEGDGPPATVAPFVRETEISIVLQGAIEPAIGDMGAHPESINIQNRNGAVTCYLELPEPLSVADIDPTSIRLNETVAPRSAPTLGDADEDGRLDLTIKFDRGAAIDRLPVDMVASVRLTGFMETGQRFLSEDFVAAFDPRDDQTLTVPTPVRSGETTLISWTASTSSPVVYDGFLSLDGGITWQAIWSGVENTETVWTVTQNWTDNARLMLQTRSPERIVSHIESSTFTIESAAADVADASVTAFLSVSPIPVRERGVLRYSIATTSDVDLSIYDVAGRLVRHLATGAHPAGVYSVPWDGTDAAGHRLSSGVYLYVFRAGEVRAEGRVLIAR